MTKKKGREPKKKTGKERGNGDRPRQKQTDTLAQDDIERQAGPQTGWEEGIRRRERQARRHKILLPERGNPGPRVPVVGVGWFFGLTLPGGWVNLQSARVHFSPKRQGPGVVAAGMELRARVS